MRDGLDPLAHQILMLGTKMVPEISVIFIQPTWPIAQENFNNTVSSHLKVRILESEKCCRGIHCLITSSTNPQPLYMLTAVEELLGRWFPVSLQQCFLFTIGSVCRIKRFMSGWQTFSWWQRGWHRGLEVAETIVKRLLCCRFQCTGKAMGQMYQSSLYASCCVS
jgi:hypothetical protein